MTRWIILSIMGLLLPAFVRSQGINFCDTNAKPSCFCDTGITPIEISCDGIGLTSIWEDTDWNVTLTALNLTNNDPLYVTFTDNNIAHIPRLPALNITLLSLCNNKIKTIEPSAFLELENLQALNLAHNELTSDAMFEGVFFGKFQDHERGYFPLPLKRLNLSYNHIHSIPKYTFDHFTNLISIDLSYNPLVTLEGNSKYAIGNLLNLEFLGLKNTSISGLPTGLLHDLSHLTALDLSYNLFKTVPKELADTHELTVLDLSGNLFVKLEKDSFEGLNYLEDLAISNVRTLREVEQFTFGPLKNLTKLTLSFNPHLKDLDDGAFEGIAENESEWPVKELYLNDNGLTHIDEGLANWKEVDLLNIQNNPFRCDCNLGWMVLNLVEKLRQTEPALTVYLTCAEPKEMKGKSITSLTQDPARFHKCSGSGKSANLEMEYDPYANDPYKAAGVTVLVIGILLITIGLSILGFVVVKRRAITQSLMAPSTIRYEYVRAETEDGPEWSYRQQPTVHK